MIVATELIPHLASRLVAARAGVAAWIASGVAVLKDLAPYAAIELILPGGSIVALLLWLYRRHQRSALAMQPSHIGVAAVSSAGATALIDRRTRFFGSSRPHQRNSL
jgi:hypothetical protein